MCCLLWAQNFAILVLMSQNLDTEVRSLLEMRRGEWKTIAAEAGISYSWISQFTRGLIPNPGYATLCGLRAHLAPASEHPAPVEAKAA